MMTDLRPTIRPPADLQRNGNIVREFRRAVEFCNIDHVPVRVCELLTTGAWQSRWEAMHNFTFEPHEFRKFISDKPPKGCGWNPMMVEGLIEKSGDQDALRRWRDAITPQHGGDRKSGAIKSDNVTLDPKRGNTLAYTLSRLHRENPELYDRVVAGEITAHRAAIEAGFRKTLTPYEQVLKLLPKLTDDERMAVGKACKGVHDAA